MKKKPSKTCALVALVLGVLFFFSPAISFGQTGTTLNSFGDVLALVEKAATWILSITIAIGVIMIVWGGFLFTTSGGDGKKIESGRKTIIWSIIGIALALLAKAIVQVTSNFLR